MSKAINSIHKIYNNPFVLTPLIVKFYEKYRGQDKDILFSYLIFPLVLHVETRDWLKKANTRSSLHSFGKKRENFYALPQRIKEYKTLTNLCMQHAIDNKMLSIRENLKVEVLKPEKSCIETLKNSLKASENIVKIIKDFDVVAVYRLLGVKNLWKAIWNILQF